MNGIYITKGKQKKEHIQIGVEKWNRYVDTA